MKKFLFLIIAISSQLSTISSHAEVNGLTPEVGKSYRLYNVGQGSYLTAQEGAFTLTSAGTVFTLAQADADINTYYLTNGVTTVFSTSFHGPLYYSDEGQYDMVRFVKSGTDSYRIAVLQNEDQYSFSSIYYNRLKGQVAKSLATVAMDDALWKFEKGTIDGIESARQTADSEQRSTGSYDVYNLAGQKVSSASVHGIYIVNGKKVVNK